LIGAVAGYVVFELIAFAYRRLRGREGLGGGDSKLLAAIGAWTGWMSLAPVVFIASLGALAVVIALQLAGRPMDGGTPIRFGPALCAAAALVLLLLPPS
jgi:leader peptidase (prepilin peptidase)/N-methyltransferase